MSFQINSDREILKAVNPSIIGTQEFTVRSGTGASEKEIIRAQLDAATSLPRVGINRTGSRVERVDVPAGQGGTGYTLVPTVTLSSPPQGGRQALASASIFNGQVIAIIVDDPGDGYTEAPEVSITGGNGTGAQGIAFLDTVDFELDINGAIRTSTSIISDTARILNLDIDNFITPDANFRAPNLKTYLNNTGILWAPNVIVQKNAFRYFGANLYQALNSGTTGLSAPVHLDGIEENGSVQFKHIGFRIIDDTQPYFNETGEAGLYPRSITPLLGDKSDKIATTEYVLNLATNDVGGRIYVSQQIGNDNNDGRSAVAPVRTIKKAAQLAWETPGVKETLIISGGDYLEDNPISIPPDASVVGDNLRLVLIRPANPRKHIFKFGDKNYVTGVTYRDQIDSNGDPVATWDFAMVFDDKQRIEIDATANGDFGYDFPVGHQIFGPNRERVRFQTNTGLSNLVAGLTVSGVNTGAVAAINSVTFNDLTGIQAYISGTVDIEILSGSFIAGETFEYYITSKYTPTNVTYDPNTGKSEITIPNHGFSNGDEVRIAIESIGFTCTMDGNNSTKYYPRSSDPAANQFLSISNVTTNTFEVSVGSSPLIPFNVSFATYNTANGIAVLTIGTHDLTAGTSIKLLGESLTFTCAADGYSSEHSYPRPSDPAYDTAIEILEVSPNTITINVGASGPSDQYEHAFVSALPGAVISGGNYPHTFVEAKANSIERIDNQYEFVSTDIKSIRAEGEVVFTNDPEEVTYPIVRIDFSKQGTPEVAVGGFQDPGVPEDLGGIVFYTNQLVGRQNIHELKEGQEILIEGLPTGSPDLSFLNGKQRIYKVLEDADGRARRFVIPKKTTVITDSNFDPGNLATVKSYTKSITISLLNSPNKFALATPVARRYQDACLQIRNNIDFIADEVVRRINKEFAKEYFSVYNIDSPNNTFDIFLGPSRFEHEYISGGTVIFNNNTYTITDFVYNHNVTGVATITTSAAIPGLVEDDIVKLADIVVECENGQKVYPSFNIPTNDSKCRRDIGHFLNAVIRDLEFGSNYNVIDSAKKYITGTQEEGQISYVNNEIIQTVRAIEYARELAIYAMRKWRTGDGTPADPLYVPQYSSLERYIDPTVIDDLASPACANVASAINTLSYLFVDVLANDASGTILDAGYLIARNRDFIADEAYRKTKSQYPSLALSNVNERKCRRDINFILSAIIRDLILGGNSGTVTAAESYFTGTELTGIPEAQREETIYAFNQVRDLSILAMRNWLTLGGSGAIYTPQFTPIPLFTDNSILIDSNGTPYCAQIESSITTLFALLEDILDGTISPGGTPKNYGSLLDTTELYTYPDSTIYDADGNIFTVRSDYDDYPIIEASPYTQNASIISFLGGGGALIDGSKVKQPNCPFPGLELDGSASYPNQGKSMVAAAFTIVSFGGTGYKVINDGYTQLVSVFVIFCADGVLAESGGYASITNSATNFGIYALRAIGYREEAYVFDVGTITNVSATPTGRTIFSIDGLGREPLEHYIIKIDGFENVNTEIEYFIDSVGAVTVGPPFTAQVTIESGSGGGAEFKNIATQQAVTTSSLVGEKIRLHRPSIVNSSSHTWEFAGSGTNYNALPENGGTKIVANEQVSEQYGRVYCSGTDELGDFKVGTFAQIENRTGNITFTGTVTISEVEFLKLKGGDVVVTGFDASNTLGGANSTDSKLPTQKAVRDYITNNLGPYINKPYSTNAVPRALVELTDSGKISVDQIPALRPFSVYTVADENERLSIEGALAGDIAIQQDTSTSYILNNDLDSLFVSFNVDPTIQFTLGDIFTGSNSNGQIQATEYRQGVVYQIVITNPGSGYTSPPVITITGGNPQAGAVQAAAVAEIANGQVVVVSLVEFNGFIGGKGYTTQPTVTFSAPTGSGAQATGVALIESRLYGDIVNRLKMTEVDSINSSDIPPVLININRVINTSGFDNNNWVSLSTNQIAAADITSGVIETARLASNSSAANSFTFLRGDQSYALAVQSLKGAERRYFARLYSDASIGASQLIFTTNSNTLLGHDVVANVVGIQENTSISGVVTAAGLTTISITNPLVASIPTGTIIEFERGSSPLTFESTFTQGSFVDSVIVASPGTGFTDGQYFDQSLSGGTGTGLKANVIVSGGQILEVSVTSGGLNYNADFNITSLPAEIGSGTGLTLQAKISTVNRQYANVSMDILRVTDQTISADEYGTIGVARFKKSQFLIGTGGNGSVVLKTGPDSGLDADLLDGAQGSYYLNASNLNAGTVPTDRMSGTYNISISGQSGNTLRLVTGVSNPTSSPNPNLFSSGIISDTRNNTADGLSDGGTRHLVLTLRNFGSGFDATGGGARQLAFTDNDNMWLRGSGTTLAEWGSWAKVWTSLNDGPGTDLDADKLDNRQGRWYQNAYNMNFGILSDNRLPSYMTQKKINTSLEILSTSGNPRYNIYISGLILTGTPFLPGQIVNLYNNLAQGVGTIQITGLQTNDDANDNFNDYTIITGVLTTGVFAGAETIGTASNRVPFQDYSLDDSGTFQVAVLESDGGTANLKLGRYDGQASSPGIYFKTSALAAANYNSAIVATGGNSTDGSGTLDAQVVNANGFSINGNTVWNAGNVTFNSTNVVGTAVIRDASGNFAAGTITANLTGAASQNVLKAGDTMSGSLTLTGPGSNLSVSGTSGFTGNVTMAADLNVDSGTLYVDSADNRVGILTTNPLAALDVRGSIYLETASPTIYFNGTSDTTGAVANSDMAIGLNNGEELIFFEPEDSSKVHFRIKDDTGVDAPFGYFINDTRIFDANRNLTNVPSITIDTANDNSGAPLYFLGSSGFRNFRIGNQLLANDIFEITPSTANGGQTWKSTPAIAIRGADNRVAINTTAFSGIDPEDGTTNRVYQLNIEGDVNFNGQLFQNNSEFVTSRWTQATNDLDIYRLSKVGINKADPSYTLHVSGNVNFEGASFTNGANTNVLYVNGDRQYIDTYGIFKTNRNIVAENITIPGNTNAMSAGPLTINNGVTITITDGSSWSIV